MEKYDRKAQRVTWYLRSRSWLATSVLLYAFWGRCYSDRNWRVKLCLLRLNIWQYSLRVFMSLFRNYLFTFYLSYFIILMVLKIKHIRGHDPAKNLLLPSTLYDSWILFWHIASFVLLAKPTLSILVYPIEKYSTTEWNAN